MDPEELGFEFDDPGDAWMDRLREAEAPRVLGNIGPYEILEEVGRGGQGVVFRARQPGTNRVIALKRLIAGSLATTSMRLRFEREVEAASALQHPNIVTVYGMEVVDGLPVLAMEWVDGVSVTRWAAGERPSEPARGEGRAAIARRSPTEILELFLRVCDAIQHAHSRGVLHRDLKPSNILVDASDQPHVLDFGLAKRFGPATDLDGGLTLSSDFVGTPTYASPEQIRSGGAPQDERSDVYALGVLLFEMLTGRAPIEPRDDLTELLRALETEEPPRPSSIDPRLGTEIDTVVRKAMARERDQRYRSADAMAADLRLYLAGEPILSAPPSGWTLVRKIVRRHRVAVAFFTTVLSLLVAFAIVALIQNRKIAHERDGAVAARLEAQDQHARAEAILGYFVNDVLMALDPKNPLHQSNLTQIIADAPERVHARFAGQPEVEAEVLRTMGELSRSQGDFALAKAMLLRSVELYESLDPPDDLGRVKASFSLARLLLRVHQLDEAERRLRDVVAQLESEPSLERELLAVALSDLSVLLFRQEEFAEAERVGESAIGVQTELFGGDHPHVGISHLNLSRTYLVRGRSDEAEAAVRRADEILRAQLEPGHPLLAQVELRLAAVLAVGDDPSAAETHYRNALDIQRRSLGVGHPDIANTLHEFAVFLLAQKRHEEGLSMFRELVEVQEARFGSEHPEVRMLKEHLQRHERTVEEFENF